MQSIKTLFKLHAVTLKTSQLSIMPHSTNLDKILSKHDLTQVNLLNEECILVDQNDRVIGSASKKDCHLWTNIESGMLHRAFSIFLFDSQNRLLLQQRSEFKITFPDHWTNTCCSHPIYTQSELDSTNGIKKAAQRRLMYEFGIDIQNVDLFQYLTRIHYKAANVPNDGGVFGEHEIDYILFLKGDFKVQPNKNEIKAYKYVDSNEMKQILSDFSGEKSTSSYKLTPWFELICNTRLFEWWKNLDNLAKMTEQEEIHKYC